MHSNPTPAAIRAVSGSKQAGATINPGRASNPRRRAVIRSIISPPLPGPGPAPGSVEWWANLGPGLGRLEAGSSPKDRRLGVPAPDDLEADRQPLRGEAAG